MPNEPQNPGPPDGFDRLVEAGRTEYRMNPRTDAPFTHEQLTKLRADLLELRLRRGKKDRPVSWEKLADQIGFIAKGGMAMFHAADLSAPTLHAWAHGKYEGDEQRVARLVDGFLADEVDRRGRLVLASYANLSNARKGLAVIREGLKQNSIVAVIGPPGCGKTTLGRAVLAERPGRAVMVTIDEHSGGKPGLTRLLWSAVAGVSNRSGDMPKTSHERWADVLDFFSRTRNSLLIVDEAQKLNRQGLEVLRDLHDKSDDTGERRLPIVLIGDPRFYRLLLKARAEKSSPLSSQLSRRIAPIFDYERDGRLGDGSTDLYSPEDLIQVLRNDRLRIVDADGIRWMTRLSNTRGYGLIGFAVCVLRTAYSACAKRPLGVAELSIALQMTLGPDVALEVDESAGGELLRATA